MFHMIVRNQLPSRATLLFTALTAGLTLTLPLAAQQQQQQSQPQSDEPPFVFKVDVVSRSAKAINFHHRQGSTNLALEGTNLAAKAKGEVRVDSKTGATKVDARIEKLPPPSMHGDGYLTYVLWAITPEGRASNLGELMLDGDEAKLQAATELQSFGLVVTAEPYFAVTMPSDAVVAEAVVKNGTTGTIMPIDTKYDLVARGGYMAQLPPGDRVRLFEAKKNIPVDLMEARQAMAIAKAAGADKYAASTIRKAEVDLQNAEQFFINGNGNERKKVQTLARHVTQLCEDARLISVRRATEDALAAERAQAEKRATELKQAADLELEMRRRAETDAAAKAQIAEEERRRSQQVREQSSALIAEKERQMAIERERSLAATADAEKARIAAENSRLQAEAARREEARVREEAAARQRQLEADAAARQRTLEAETARAREAAEKAEAERLRLRAELTRQLNLVLSTRETARGLIVNMSDVLFDTGVHTLRPAAREKLARISGILQVYPDMKIEVEGHTDSVGSDDFNQKLSERRADSVRVYLLSQGVPGTAVTAKGFGESMPVADNMNAAGRQQNRRVELVVSGPMIDKTVHSTSLTQQQ